MPIEVATYVGQLSAANPLATDKKNQGDDHLRLIKAALLATLPNADRPMRAKEVTTKNANANIVETDDGKLILCDASGAAFALNFPAGLTFDGWYVDVMKTDTTDNPVYVLPPSGTINGFAKIRVSVPYLRTRIMWTGSAFIRLQDGVPPAGVIELCGGTVPAGYEAADGVSLPRDDCPELFARWGTTWGAVDASHFNAPDLRDKFLTGAGSTYALGASGGAATVTVGQANLPALTLNVTIPAGQGSHSHPHAQQMWGNHNGVNNDLNHPGSGNTGSYQSGTQNATLPQLTGTAPLGGSGTALENRPPYAAVNYIFRVC